MHRLIYLIRTFLFGSKSKHAPFNPIDPFSQRISTR